MDLSRYPTGPGLEELYLRDRSHEDLKDPENLKLLLDHILNKNTRELTNSDLEIIDFCMKGADPDEYPEEEKVQFLSHKYHLIGKEQKKRRYFYRVSKIAACFVFVLLGGIIIFNGPESEAGIFDWVRSLFVEEDGEQLSISTPNNTMANIELKEGHLPKEMPEGYLFNHSDTSKSSPCTTYIYYFSNKSDEILTIRVKEFKKETTLFNNKNEINKNSLEIAKYNGTEIYYTKNKDTYSISWISELKLYTIIGVHSFDELESILSHY